MRKRRKRTICRVKDCKKKIYGRGLCTTHYWRLMRNGSLERKTQIRGTECSVEDCKEKVYAKGLCHKHWQRKREYGSTDRSVLQQPWRNKETWSEYLERKSKRKRRTGCIEWIDYRDRDGYGAAWYNGKPIRAHRLSYMINVGPIPKGMLVCHHCDNPKCINPDHLYVGTQQDNVNDKMKRGRSNIKRGQDSGSAKLTEKQAKEIIKRKGQDVHELAKHYGVSHWSIYDIWKGRSWKHLER